MAVAVLLAVRLVVLVVVGDEVAKREPIMGGDEVDARPGLSATKVELVGRGAETRRQGLRTGFAAPIVADCVPERVVPFGPARRKPADLIASGPAIPRLGDQLHLGEPGILAYRFEKAALGFEAVRFARENRAEIEAETVDAHLADPIAQAVGDHLDHP